MSDVFFPLPTGYDLLTALITQSQSVRHFGVTELEAEETLSLLSEALAPALYQAGGLLNEQALELFFADPLPNAPLAAALETQAGPDPSRPLDKASFSRKHKKDSGEQILNSTSAPAEAKTGRQKLRSKKQRESNHTDIEQSVSTEQQSAKRQKNSAGGGSGSDVFSPLPQRSGLLADLINQSRSVRHFGVTEGEASEMRSLLNEGRPRALHQAGGLLNEQALEPFFADPLPDAALAAALKTPAGPDPSPPLDKPPISPKQKMHSGEEILNSRSAPAEKTVGRQKLQSKKQRESNRPEIERTDPIEQQPANSQKHSSGITQTIEQKVTVLQESKKRVDSHSEQQQATAVTQFSGKERKASTKSRRFAEPGVVPARQAQSQAIQNSAVENIEKQAINPRQAAKMLDKKWMHQAWNSPINTSGKPTQIALPPDDKHQTRSDPGETAQRVTEERLEQKVAQLLDRKFATGEQRESVDTVVAAKPQAGKKLTPASKEFPQQKPLSDLYGEQANARAFTSPPPISTKPEGLVGLRGLAARAAANESAAPVTGADQTRTTVDQAVVAAQGQASAAVVAQAGASEQANNTTRAVSVSELAELIAQEAKRAGINLEQFQP